MGFHATMAAFLYTTVATLVVVLLNLQAPGTWQSAANQLFLIPNSLLNVTGSPGLSAELLDVLFVGSAFLLGQVSVRRIRGEGYRRGQAAMIAKGKG